MKNSTLFSVLWLFPFGALAQHSEQNYRQLIQNFFNVESPLCLGEKQWPVLSSLNESPWISGRLQALVDAGLAYKSAKGRVPVYRLSALGEKNWHQYGDLCYGRMAVDVIKKIDPINKELTVVYFTYRLTGLESWSQHPSLRLAFSELDQLVTGVGITQYSVTIRKALGGAAKLQDYPAPVMLDY